MEIQTRIYFQKPCKLSADFYAKGISEVPLDFCNQQVIFILNVFEARAFYQCECRNGGTSSFSLKEGNKIPNEILEEMRIHVEMAHAEGEWR